MKGPARMSCPACGNLLQPLEPESMWVDLGMAYAAAQRPPLTLPTHGPAALVFLALVAHAKVVHPELDLQEYLEVYLDS